MATDTAHPAPGLVPGRLETALARPVSPASLVVFRAVFGLLLVVAVVRFAAHGWIDEYFLAPRYFFPFPGLEWIRPWPGHGMYVHFAVMGVAALGIATGVWFRASALVFSLAFTWAHFVDRTNYLNHYYFVSLMTFLIAWLPLGRGQLRGSVPAWVVWAVRGQLAVVYVFGGVAKLQADWLLQAEPLTTWLLRNQDFPVLGPYLGERWVAYAMSWGGAAFDLLVVPCLCWGRTRPFAYAAVLGFHLVTARLFHIGMFPWIMIGCGLIYFTPDWPHRFVAWWRGRSPVVVLVAPPSTWAVPRWAPMLVALWLGVQVLASLRAFAYAGDPRWTEEGFRFSWRVMVMEKNGAAEFVITDPDDGRTWRVLPGEYLTPHQARQLSSQPDMILSFAHLLDAEFRARGVRDPVVRADVRVSLNGRPAAPLIDTAVDLSREHEGLGRRRWVTPWPPDAHAQLTQSHSR
jgi:vitamin K-dependent gamma-carboxylase